MSTCFCGGPSYESCCKPRHDGSKPAPTAEALMRSRYSAFATANVDYLRDTQTRPTRETSWEDTKRWASSVAWVGLTIADTVKGTESDADGIVEFIARYIDNGELTSLRERSTFVRRDGRWIYDDGTPEVTQQKLERNAPCPCGSGKKFKQCHA
ncbi:MAG: hypothetical protein DI536_16235 [Archangium gephyra]|uniref:YchJ-like middle NTF2-like domain-containing protein n=1 Tax=Archangium gephyra TaxID=48 RepID=A0A2W5TAH8_9BACT|nr:MAG: hypothetical protein DI536_16235 [Archangium gephyra]